MTTLRHLGRRWADQWTTLLAMTAQDRADAYVARMPIAVISN